MTINPVLMKAILSMDSYNRGYNAAIEVTGNAVGSAQILTTTLDGITVNLDSRIIRDPVTNVRLDENIGFYALAYEIKDDNGTVIDTVISYRGTDDTDDPTSLDQQNGWLVGGGVYGEPQANMAVDFIESVSI